MNHLPVSQLTPVYPGSHAHTYWRCPLEQLPCTQGELAQLSAHNKNIYSNACNTKLFYYYYHYYYYSYNRYYIDFHFINTDFFSLLSLSFPYIIFILFTFLKLLHAHKYITVTPDNVNHEKNTTLIMTQPGAVISLFSTLNTNWPGTPMFDIWGRFNMLSVMEPGTA